MAAETLRGDVSFDDMLRRVKDETSEPPPAGDVAPDGEPPPAEDTEARETVVLPAEDAALEPEETPVQLALGDLHEETRLAHDLFRDGHRQEAVRKAAQRFLNRLSERAEHSKKQGTALVNLAFSENAPLLAFTARATRAERDEHDGYRFLGVGLTLAVRNVMTHTDDRGLTPTEALEWLAFISAMHRRLDDVQQVPRERGGDSEGAEAS